MSAREEDLLLVSAGGAVAEKVGKALQSRLKLGVFRIKAYAAKCWRIRALSPCGGGGGLLAKLCVHVFGDKNHALSVMHRVTHHSSTR